MSDFRIRDPIHGFIDLSDAERSAIDAPVFQRLRDIRQLAMTHLVYPGALHTRFEHSLGVCHIAGKVADELGLGDDDREVVRAAALMHDVGHGPFSHVSEAELDFRSGVHGVHEAISVALMRTDTHLRAAFGDDLCDRAADLVGHMGDFSARSTMRDIVSGPSDADKLDYLLRDSYFAGVNYGRYDLPRLLDTVVAITDGELQSFLGFKAGGLWAVEELLLARHHMHRQVYGHKTRIATDIMVRRALSLGIDDGVIDAAAFKVPIEGTEPAPDEEFLATYARQTDSSVMRALLEQPKETRSREMAERLTGRQLLRRVAHIDLKREHEKLGGPRVGRILDPERTDPKLPELEQEIAGQLKCPAQLVALRIDEPGNPVYRRPDPDVSAKDILLKFDDREPDLIQGVSEVFRNSAEANQRFASLYTPKLEDLTDDTARECLWQALKTL